MTQAKRWPNGAEGARQDALTEFERIEQEIKAAIAAIRKGDDQAAETRLAYALFATATGSRRLTEAKYGA